MRMAIVAAVGVLAFSVSYAHAEVRMEERDGVLYVTNIESPARVTPIRVEAAQSPDSYRALIREIADRHAVAPALVESVIRAESNFDPRAVSPKGARGLMQLMPATAARLGVRNVFDARENVEGGVRHLRSLMDRYEGDVSLALAAYNAGVEAVARHKGIPPYAETQAYVASILRRLAQDATPSPIAARALYRYEGRSGRVVYSNLPIERLSSTTRELLEGGD